MVEPRRPAGRIKDVASSRPTATFPTPRDETGEGLRRAVAPWVDPRGNADAPGDEKPADTELVMVLERRGEGWSEEIFPHVVMKRVARDRSAAAVPKTKPPDSAQTFLIEQIGFSPDEAASIVAAAAAWRVTRGGRALVDRKLMRAVQENARTAVTFLVQAGAKRDDVPDLLRSTPQILAIVPNSDWNRQLLSYIVRTKAPGGGRFGPVRIRYARSKSPDPLKPWVEDVRIKRQLGELSQEQLYMIDVAGFDADVKPKKTESGRTWEVWFDELVDYSVTSGTCEFPEERKHVGLARWLDRQKQKHADGKLPKKARERLINLGVKFDKTETEKAEEEKLAKKKAAKGTRAKGKKAKDTASTSTPGLNYDETGGGGGESWDGNETSPAGGWESALDSYTIMMLSSFQAYVKEEGEYAEPPFGSQLAVWLAKTRARAESGAMPEDEREALVKAGVELQNFSLSWLMELEQFAALRKHKVTLHTPAGLTKFIRDQRARAALGQLTDAELKRLRAAGMSGLAGALMLDESILEEVDGLVFEIKKTKPAEEPEPDMFETMVRENTAAKDAAAAMRREAKRAAREGKKPSKPATIPARARVRMIGPLKSPLTSAVKERPPAKERPKPRRIPGRGPAVSASQDEETATETADEETVTETADEEAGIVPVEARK